MTVCEQVHVLDFGRLIASGDPAAVQNNKAVADAYLGEQLAATEGADARG
jgi:branched-chain amino acid transport system ATP-binding protein